MSALIDVATLDTTTSGTATWDTATWDTATWDTATSGATRPGDLPARPRPGHGPGGPRGGRKAGLSCTAARGPGSGAVSLLNEANRGLVEAEWEPEAVQKFTTAYLAALRAAAAMLALRGRPHRGRAKPTSAWVLLAKVAPELSEWSAFFSAASPLNAAVQAGIGRPVSPRYADDMVRQTGQFLALVEHALPRPAR